MKIYRSAVPGVEWPAIPMAKPATQMALAYQLMQSQWWPRRLRRAWQARQLVQLLRHAQLTVPFYQTRLMDVVAAKTQNAFVDAWLSVPVLERADVQQHKDELSSNHVPESHGPVTKIETSGTTGTPIATRSTMFAGTMMGAMTLRSHYWRNWDTNLSFACIRHAANGDEDADTGRELPVWGSLTGGVFHTGPGHFLGIRNDIETQADWLARVNPHYLMTYPTNALHLARYCGENGIHLPNLAGIETVSEVVTPEVRRVCKDTWNADIFANYSALETGPIAYQCPDNEHYHVQSEAALVEILDEENKPCPPGVPGRVVITPLHNLAMPLIRYALGDYAEFGEACSCGRTLPVLSRILGRRRNMLVHPDGRKVWLALEAEMFTRVAPVRQFQIIQHALDDIEVRLVVARPMSQDQEGALRERLNEEFLHSFPIRFTYENAIARTPGGKHEEFICRV